MIYLENYEKTIRPFFQVGPVNFVWLPFSEYSHSIIALREQVFVQEQGIGYLPTYAAQDECGLHLGAFMGDELVAAISAYSFQTDAPFLQQLGLPDCYGHAVQLSRRVALPKARGSRLAQWMGCKLWLAAQSLWQPQYHFLTLLPQHFGLTEYYRSLGYQLFTETVDSKVLWVPRVEIAPMISSVSGQLEKCEETMAVRLPVTARIGG
ncbi:MAG: hypothetical protein AAFQ98_20785 [Bacteroidota bacterium]